MDYNVNSGAFGHDYAYDLVGNRLSIDSSTSSYQPAVYNDGRSSSINSDILKEDPSYTYEYDQNGSLIKRTLKTDASQYREYYYDWDQKLVEVRDYASGGLTQTIDYTYDPMGNLVKKVKNGTETTKYVQDLNAGLPVVLLELNSTDQVTAAYTYGEDRIKVSSNGEYYYFYDGLASTRTITDTQGVVKARYVYDVYGKPNWSESYEDPSVDGQPFLFTGELYDRDTELVYLRARWYDPGTGRFLSRDTYQGQFDNPGSMHRYAYCGSDPANMYDPTGHWEMADTMAAMTILTTWATMNSSAIIQAGGMAIDLIAGFYGYAGPDLVPGNFTSPAEGATARELAEEAERAALPYFKKTLGEDVEVVYQAAKPVGTHGIDMILRCRNTGKYFIIEAKRTTKSAVTTLLGKLSDGSRQFSPRWIWDSLETMRSEDAALVEDIERAAARTDVEAYLFRARRMGDDTLLRCKAYGMELGRGAGEMASTIAQRTYQDLEELIVHK